MILDEVIGLTKAEDISLNPGASESCIDSLESLIDMDLPDDYWTFLNEHDGQRMQADPLLSCYRLLSIEEMEIEYIRRLDRDKKGHAERSHDVTDVRVQAGLQWRPGWLFFAREVADGNFLVMDFSPTAKGTPGQIFEHHYEEPHFRVLANNFTQLVEITCEQINAGTRYGIAMYDRLEFDD